MERKERPKPLLKRDEHNQIVDPDEASRLERELLAKLIAEQRLHEKDNSFHVSKTGRRDIVVHMSVTILPFVDGHRVVGEHEREYNQWCFRIGAKHLPISNANAIKAFSELFHVGKQALMKLGLVRV